MSEAKQISCDSLAKIHSAALLCLSKYIALCVHCLKTMGSLSPAISLSSARPKFSVTWF